MLCPMEVRGLRAFWERRTRHLPASAETVRVERVLLDALGLGIEQTAEVLSTHLSFPDFRRWIEQVAGPPDRERIARYHAFVANAPPPPGTAARLAEVDAMADVLGAADLAHWGAQGYVILRQAISPAEVEAAAALLWETTGARPEDPATWYGARKQGLMVQIFQHPALESARRSSRAHKAFAQLWGTSDLWSTIDRMSFNAPVRAGRGFWAPRLHWDVSLTRPIPFATQGILYLADTAEHQGALELVPGFHHRIDTWLDGLGDADPRRVDLGGEAVRIAADAGDLVIWRHDLPHGASPNLADRPRLAQYVNMYAPTLAHQREWR